MMKPLDVLQVELHVRGRSIDSKQYGPCYEDAHKKDHAFTETAV